MKLPIFRVNDKVVYPGHGVAEINDIVEQHIEGCVACFYKLSFFAQGTTILVPVESAEQVGLRHLSDQSLIEHALLIISQPSAKFHHHELSASSWNKRNKQYQMKIRKGGLLELSEIYRDLKLMQHVKELSFGEKALLSKTESLIVEEISLAQEKSGQTTAVKIRSLCKPTKIMSHKTT